MFYDKNYWHILINKGLRPFVERADFLESYYLGLSEEMGDHIKMVLITNKKHARSLAEKADIFFKDFFLKNQSLSTGRQIPEHGLFMKFQNNSIHYGVFDGIFIKNPVDVFGKYRKDLSIVMLHIFKKYGCSTLDDLVEIGFQLFAIFCKEANLKSQDASKIFDSILESEYKRYDSELLDKILSVNRSNFEKNKTSILDYLYEINAPGSKLLGEQWQTSWRFTVKTCCGSLRKTIPENRMCVEYRYMIESILNTFDFRERISICSLFSNALKVL